MSDYATLATGLARRLLPTADVDVGARLRPVDPSYVQFLARSLDEQGLQHPIVVRPSEQGRWRLVAGAHRLAAAKALGWDEISAEIRDDLKNDDEARLAEIAENLMRRELSALDRATFLMEWRETMYRLHPELRQGGDRQSAEFLWKKSQTANLAVWSEVAARVGLSERSIQRACRIAETLHDDVKARLRGTELADNQSRLEALARFKTRTEQLAALDIQLRGPEPRVVPTDDEIFSRFLRSWNALPLRLQRRFRRDVLGEEKSGE